MPIVTSTACRKISSSVLAALLFLVTSYQSSLAAPGDVDPSFGFAGKVVSNAAHGADEILAVAIQPDGKILAVGSVQSPRSFLISRHNANGSLDTSFGNGGNVITNFPAGPSSAHAVALQSDGKIVVAGKAGDMFALARYNSDGTSDESFGSGGLIAKRFEPENLNTLSLASSVAIQSDGKIVVAGDSFLLNPAAPSFVTDCNVGLVRFNSDGTLDESFGNAGFVVSDFGSFDRADALAIQSDGKIIVAGDSNSTGVGPYTLILTRYNSDGTVDETFGTAGRAIPVSGSFEVAAAALQPDGKIVVAGTLISSSPANADFALARYNSDGTLDSTFGVGGLAVTDFAWTGSATGRENVAATLALQSDGKFVLGGYSSSSFAVARYNADGSPDVAFGDSGISIIQVGSLGLSTFNFPVASSSTFSLVIIGASGIIGGQPFCFLFPSCGVSLSLFLVEQTFALALQDDGKIIAGGVLDKHAALVRYHGVTTPKLTVIKSGPGIGGVWSPDGAISCGTRCSASYDAGSTVLLGWAVATGSYFSSWHGCTPIAGGGCMLTLSGDTTVTGDFDLDIPLSLDTTLLPNGEVGVPYVIQVAVNAFHFGAAVVQQPQSSRVISGTLPAGLTLNGRLLSGTPLKAGKSKFTVDFTDPQGAVTRESFNLTIFKPLSIATQNLKAGRVGRAYNSALKAQGGEGNHWSLAAGNLPAGLALDGATGKISGFPTVAGTFNLTIRVTDIFDQTIDKSFTLVIN